MAEKAKGDIVEATGATEEFFKKTLKKPNTFVVKTTATDTGWEARAEVIEESESMKAIGKRVIEKHLYDVILDKNLNISSYDRHEKMA